MATAWVIAVLGVACLAPPGCGYSADILTTASSDPGTQSSGSDSAGEAATDLDTGNGETDTGAVPCTRGLVRPGEVALIGDSWMSFPGPRVGELARAAGALELGEDYVYRAAAGATIEAIVQQYEGLAASADSSPKVVIMNGGAVDTYGALGSEASISHVVGTFDRYLERLAAGSAVAHVIYVLYSEGSTIPGVAELRRPMQRVCAESAVPCLFIDLQPLWEGHPEYTSQDTINPSAAGSEVIAQAIWQTLQDNCIAQ